MAAPSADGGWELNAVSVGDKTSGNIYMLSGSQVYMKFYAWAHGHQMPLRRVIADKGDGITIDTAVVGSLGNRKYKCTGSGVCGDEADGGTQFPCSGNDDCAPAPAGNRTCDTSGLEAWDIFGNTSGTGCKEKPWEFVMDYNCPYGAMEVVVKGEQPEGGGDIDWNYINRNFSSPPYVCVAQPKVYVLDNWGWCAGSCSVNSDGSPKSGYEAVKGRGCYGEMGALGDQCNPLAVDGKAWVNYKGYIVVVPTD